MNKTQAFRLLYVEDDEALREQFMRVLKPKFKEVYEAADGLQALDMYAEYHPDMMLVDITLPKIDGLEVIETVRNHDKETAIMVLSAYSDQEKLLKAVKLGLSDYLVKPVPYKRLLVLFEEIASKLEVQQEKNNVIILQNGYFWKKEEKILSYGKQSISLTKRERLLLDLLIEKRNQIVTFNVIEALLWDIEDEVDHKNSLSLLLKRLRNKLPVVLIENIYAEGYRISVP